MIPGVTVRGAIGRDKISIEFGHARKIGPTGTRAEFDELARRARDTRRRANFVLIDIQILLHQHRGRLGRRRRRRKAVAVLQHQRRQQPLEEGNAACRRGNQSPGNQGVARHQHEGETVDAGERGKIG